MKTYFINSIRFVLLILVQVLILNHFDVFGYVNPYIYPLLIILLPFNINSIQKLVLAFILGICLDFFEDSGGIHAAATLVIAYLRPLFLRNAFGLSYDYQTLKFYDAPFRSRLVYVSLMVLVHHTVLFTLEIFSLNHLLYLAEKIIYSSIFSILLIIITLNLIRKNSK
ncbi:rod shape-determining protein MreD [Psychroflexus montanilacus]|uniref:rod shape-determining protein MreD n=1 Tax=Psychroflexus montanilacus TaxID=2873598 RepID=UPI001CCB71A8|nr:rod shape-determining protein MreD [Psychroflexus montanilacus]MBZ9652216.1 rod shape-determining protein MreD [Psychroflexus montanilacus]